MYEKLNEEILDKLTKVCLCKAITKAKIKDAINNGANTLEKVQKSTGAGSGSCKGRRCTPKILEIINEFNNKE